MIKCRFIEGTRRDFIRKKRRFIRQAKKIHRELRMGCALNDVFDGTPAYFKACRQMGAALRKMDKITKPLR